MPIEQINAWSTVVVAATAVVSVILSMFLLFEQRANRNNSAVEAYPTPYGPSGMVIAIRLENYGPAPARDVELVYRVKNADGSLAGEKRHAQPVLVAGAHIKFLPDLVIPNRTGGMSLADLSSAGFHLEASWGWADERRLFRWRLPRERHSGRFAVAATDLQRDLYGGWSVHEDTLEESLKSIADDLERMRKSQERRDAEERLARWNPLDEQDALLSERAPEAPANSRSSTRKPRRARTDPALAKTPDRQQRS